MRLRDILKLDVEPRDVVAFGPAIDAIDAYIRSPHSPRSGKLLAAAKLDEILGLPKPANPEYALNVYLAIPDADAVFVETSTLAEVDDGTRFDPTSPGMSDRQDITREQLYASEDEFGDAERMEDYP